MSDLPRFETHPLPDPRKPERVPPTATVKRYPRRPVTRPLRPIPGLQSLALQACAALAIVLIVVSLSVLDFAPGRELISGLRYVLHQDAGSPIAVFLEQETVFSHAPMAEVPVAYSGGLLYSGQGRVSLVADGAVFYRGVSKNGLEYLLVRHSNGYQSRYEGLSPSVEAGDELTAGDALGSVAEGGLLYFSLTQYGAQVTLTP